MYSYSPPLSLPPTLVLPPCQSCLLSTLVPPSKMPSLWPSSSPLTSHSRGLYMCIYCRHVPSDNVRMFSVRMRGPCVQCYPPFLSMQEFFSYGADSLVTSFFSCFSSSGSLSRTTVAGSTGVMTQVSALGVLQADTLWLYVLSNIQAGEWEGPNGVFKFTHCLCYNM